MEDHSRAKPRRSAGPPQQSFGQTPAALARMMMMSRSAGPATWRLLLDPCRPDVTPAMQCWSPGLPSQPGISACSRLSGLDELTLSGEKLLEKREQHSTVGGGRQRHVSHNAFCLRAQAYEHAMKSFPEITAGLCSSLWTHLPSLSTTMVLAIPPTGTAGRQHRAREDHSRANAPPQCRSLNRALGRPLPR